MTLGEHLEESGETQRDFAARVGTHQSAISRICKGRQRVSLDLALRIEAATGGRVTVRDLAAPAASAGRAA